MKHVLALSLMALLLTVATPAAAQDGEGYFHVAAQEYTQDKLQQALATVHEGLQIEPDNAKLQALKQKLEEERQQQQQNQQGQNEQDRTEQENGQSQQQDQQQEQQEEGQQQQESEQQQQDAQQQGSSGNPQEGGEEQQQPPQGQPELDPNKLSPEQAERILQALGNEEEELLREVMKLKSRPRRVEKDW